MNKGHLFIFSILIFPFSTPCSIASANGLFEAILGSTTPSGSSLDSEMNLGGQLTLGLGGKLPTMSTGSAIYAYGAIRRDKLSQQGPRSLGVPILERSQWTPSLGVRFYNATSHQWRIYFDLGLGMTFDRSEVFLMESRRPTAFTGETSTLSTGIGFQYKISPGLLLSVSYEQLFYISPDQIGLSEEALITGSESSINGRGRLGIGLGFYL